MKFAEVNEDTQYGITSHRLLQYYQLGQYTGTPIQHAPIQCHIKYVFSWTPNDFPKIFKGVSRHKKFMYFRPYHRILTKIFSVVEKKNRRGERFDI